MASTVKVKLVKNAAAKLMKSPGVTADIKARVERVAAAAGEGYEASVVEGKNRAHGSVITASYAAMRREARDHTLIRALDAGR